MKTTFEMRERTRMRLLKNVHEPFPADSALHLLKELDTREVQLKIARDVLEENAKRGHKQAVIALAAIDALEEE